jgi:hypothetical protein
MIILHESMDLDPASPETIDAYVELSRKERVSLAGELGGRLVGAFSCNADWFAQVQELWAFEDLATFGAFHERAKNDVTWQACEQQVAQLAPRRRSQLLEPLGPVPVGVLDEAIEASVASPVGVYSLADLEVRPGRMDDFVGLLEAGAASLPIIACLRPVTGNPLRVLDLWTRAMGSEPYQPAAEPMKGFFRALRDVAPTERLTNWSSLPHSPLR